MDIRHNEVENKFFVRVEGRECALVYKKLSDRLWNFESTSTPEKLTESEKGALEEMIRYAIEFVKDHGIKILVSCYDVQEYLIKHRKLKDLVYHPY